MAIALGVVSCGGSDSGADLPDVADIVGTYELTSFEVAYDSGTTITEEDYPILDSEMKIYPDNRVTQDIWITGGSLVTIENTIVGRTDTQLQVDADSCTYWLDYSFDNTTFVTTLVSGEACGVNDFRETDTWVRTSTSVEAHSPAPLPETESARKLGTLGSIVGAGRPK